MPDTLPELLTRHTMSIQRIDAPGTRGYQARAHVRAGKRLTRFFADDSHGGPSMAWLKAADAERQLQARAERLRKAGA